MKAQQDTMNNFFSLLNTRFSIPVYQRNYTWAEENCAKLLEDIVSISRDNDKTHFMGTITFIIHLVPDEDGLRNTQEYVIIDGQQRITTTMLLLKAIHQKSRDERTKNEIARILSDDSTSDRLRLKPIERDREAYVLVMKDRWNEYVGDSKIKNNYHFFIKELDRYIKKGYTIEEIYGAFLRLKIVGIGLEKGDDDPQVVFESINATGVHLEGIDLIRNYLMMGEDSKTQETLYGEYWIPIENWLKKEKIINEFIEAYLRIYYDIDVKKGEVYNTFKKHCKEHFKDDIEGLMGDLRNYARIYQIFTDIAFDLAQPDASGRELAILRNRFNTIVDLKFGVSYPFILQLASDFEQSSLDFENFNAMLEILISYYVRRMICGIETNALNKVTYTLYKYLKEQDIVSASGLAQFLGQKGGREIFPDDEYLKRAFVEEGSNAYSLRACKYILLEIERLITAEPPEVDNLEIEHFYPQKPTQKWRDLVGEEYERLEQNFIHTFGNLALTGQNAKLGNKPFEEKIEILLEKGSLKLNEYFTNMTSWGIAEIKERSLYLADRFCEVPVFRDLPKRYRIKSIFKTLNDDLTFQKVSLITFPNGEEQAIHNAKTLAKAVIDYMYRHHREAVEDALNKAPRYITFDKKKADAKDVAGSLCVKCENGGFYFISNASLRDVGRNLSNFVDSTRENPEKFILR